MIWTKCWFTVGRTIEYKFQWNINRCTTNFHMRKYLFEVSAKWRPFDACVKSAYPCWRHDCDWIDHDRLSYRGEHHWRLGWYPCWWCQWSCWWNHGPHNTRMLGRALSSHGRNWAWLNKYTAENVNPWRVELLLGTLNIWLISWHENDTCSWHPSSWRQVHVYTKRLISFPLIAW